MTDTLSFFAETVDQAHAGFRASAQAAGLAIEEYTHPLAGPDGEPLATALGWTGPRHARRVVAVISGVHGVEGFAGAAIQRGWIERFASAPLPDDTAVLLLHLINPWGTAWSRRETEDNVDLFRNLAYPGPDYPRNALYERYEAGINPRSPAGPERAEADRLLAAFEAEHGRETVLATIRRGQHHYPKGMTFNGAGPTWSSRLVERIGSEWLASAARVDVLDIHTGFGAPGDVLFIPAAPPGSALYARIERWFGGRLFRQGSDALIPAHPRAPFDSWAAPPPGSRTICSIGVEFGTADTSDDLPLLRDFSAHANYGSLLSAEGTALRGRFREKFYPSAPAWRERVLETGIAAIEHVLRLAEP